MRSKFKRQPKTFFDNDSNSSIFTSISSDLDTSGLIAQQKPATAATTTTTAHTFKASKSNGYLAERRVFKPISVPSSPLQQFTRRASYNVYEKHDQFQADKAVCLPKNERKTLQKLQLKNLNAQAVKQQENLVKFKSRNKSPHIDIIDNHLLIVIFSKLSTVEKLMLQFVCKRWHHIIWSQEYSYTLFRHVDIASLSIPLYCYNFNFKNLLKAQDETRVDGAGGGKKGFVKFLKGKLGVDGKGCCGGRKTLTANRSIIDEKADLAELKENNFLKFHINADRVLEFLLNKLLF